ncbi:hypothetical protein IMCC14465_11310 [alpha proteobacterium IMCC14465]|uniref:Riboflavin biosynthesis protein n=1 Tax=alpha proteobacterium IMCC14465 TaxID=1220535 RepID=J9A4N1_9PROT|nr:hypothetical protein IMCC14465_11310 [alpha proteobacterium IMCC14465]
MGLFRDLSQLPETAKGGVLVIGNFDGVHKGHQAVLSRALEKAQALDSDTATPEVTVLVFDPHPRQYFAPHAPPLRLTRLETRARLLEQYGATNVVALTFDKDMAEMSAEDFIQKIISESFEARAVCIGHDFHFGKNRAGTPDMLKTAGEEAGFEVLFIAAVSPENTGERPYSSTAIRECLTRGEIAQATRLLGDYWRLEAVVDQGDQRGRTINFPTANLSLQDYHLPLFGVYAVTIEMLDGAFAGQKYTGVANLGIRPSFETEAPRLEVFIFDFDGDIYGDTLSVGLVDFIRPEQQFDKLDALKAQIARDVQSAREVLASL